MNARIQMTPDGHVTIPQDVRDRLDWGPGTPLDLVETADGISLRRRSRTSVFPPKTLADLHALPRYDGPPQSIEAISRLSDEDVFRMLDEGD